VHLKSIVQIVFSGLFFLFLSACDSDAIININDKNLKSHPLKCLAFIPKNNSELERSLKQLYLFDKRCRYKLELSYKSSILCNSPYNIPLKTTSNFPTAYLELDVRDGMKILYSYYRDLTDKPTVDELKEAFEHLRDDIL